MDKVNGIIAGYDPGGNGRHGVAIAEFRHGLCQELTFKTFPHAQSVIDRLSSIENLIAIGIDTLLAWSAGHSGWRPADLWLRRQYPEVQHSVLSPNSLFGAMALSGIIVLKALRDSSPSIAAIETHPRVLYWALSGRKLQYENNSAHLDRDLGKWLGAEVKTRNAHEWDAGISVLAALKGLRGEWDHDLFSEIGLDCYPVSFPAGKASYWWPH